MSSAIIFDSIPLAPPIPKIYARLGYSRHRTELKNHQKKDIDNHIEKALSLIDIKGAAKRMKIERKEDQNIFLNRNICFSSSKLTKFLTGSDEVLLMASTSGKRVMDAIVKNSEEDNLTFSVILDAVASEIADSALQWIMDYFSQNLKRESKALTSRRFSAGYGDFDLSHQKIIYDLLELEKLDIQITSEYILIPEKSVTAVAGLQAL